jgi:hypothetical protein
MHARSNVILVVHSRTHRHWPDTSTIHKARAGLSVICVPAGRPTSRRREFVGPEPHLLAVAQSGLDEAVFGHGFAGINGSGAGVLCAVRGRVNNLLPGR